MSDLQAHARAAAADLGPPPRRIRDLDTHPEPWLRVSQVAEYLQVSDRQVWKWHRAGVLEIRNFGDRINRVALTELRRFLGR